MACKRPSRVGGLLVALLAALLGVCSAQKDCYGALVELAVLAAGSSTALDAYYGYPVPFGRRLNDTAVRAPLAPAVPLDACGGALPPPPIPFSAALVARGNCTFTEKARALQAAGYAAMLLFNNEPDCVVMAAPRNETRGLDLAVVSLTRQAGEALQALLAEHSGAGELSVQLRMPAEGAVDWSSLLLWLIATGTVAGGALWAGHGHWAGLGREPGGSPAKRPGAGEVPSVTIGPRAAAGFVVLASAMLLLLFFFLDAWLATLLVVMFGLGAWQAVSMVLFSALQHASSAQWRSTYVRLPLGLGLVPLNGVLAGGAGAAVCATWAAWHNAVWSWPLQDAMGVCFMLVILKQFFLPNLKVASILLCLAFVYDVWWVFLQPLVTGGASVMIEVATGGASHEQLPMVLRVPHNALGSNPAFAILGLGDVVLPGLLAVFCRRFDLSQRLPLAKGYFLPCVVGYGGGMLLTYAALWFSWFGDQGQPALLYLVPATLGSVSLLAAARGQFRLLWDNDFEPLGGSASSRDVARQAEAMEAGAEPEAQLLPDSRSSPGSRERLLPSPFDRSRSSSRESDLRID